MRLRLVQLHLVRPRINDRKQVTLLCEIAFAELVDAAALAGAVRYRPAACLRVCYGSILSGLQVIQG